MTQFVEVSYNPTLVTVEAVEILLTGELGPQGPAGAGAGAQFNFTSSSTWIINHNLGYRPSVQVFNAASIETLAEIVHTSVNQTQVLLSTPMAGFARIT